MSDVYWDDLAPRLEGLVERIAHIEKYLADLGEAVGHPFLPFSTGLPPEVAELARAGKTLEAVTLYRKLANVSFEQAKLAVQKATTGGG